MKTCVIFFLLFDLLFANESKLNHLNLNTHQNVYSNNDSLYVTKDLPILVADPCIEDLLEAVAKSNSKYYRWGKSFYGHARH